MDTPAHLYQNSIPNRKTKKRVPLETLMSYCEKVFPFRSEYECFLRLCCAISSVHTTEHMKDPVPLIEKRRGLSPGGRVPPSFIHQVIHHRTE